MTAALDPLRQALERAGEALRVLREIDGQILVAIDPEDLRELAGAAELILDRVLAPETDEDVGALAGRWLAMRNQRDEAIAALEAYEGAPTANLSGTCGSCGAAVAWVRTKAGKAMPVDPAPRMIVTKDGEAVRGYTSHFASCPNAAKHRAQKAKRGR